MRHQLLKLTKHNSTKAERICAELCKELRIPFRAKVKINNREADFIIGTHIIEWDGHTQSAEKNRLFLEAGYTPIHIPNDFAEDREWLREILINLKHDNSLS